MKFKLINSSASFKGEIELNTLEELINWIKEIGEDIIIQLNHFGEGEDVIEIYDDYRE